MVERVKAYDPNVDEEGLDRAYVFAMKAHGSQKRASGDPYFSHPIEVAGILTGIKLDSATIVTALLHDTVEDTNATIEDIEHLFGEEIAQLVDGVTKLSRIELQSDHTQQAENFRKLLLAMSDDIRGAAVRMWHCDDISTPLPSEDSRDQPSPVTTRRELAIVTTVGNTSRYRPVAWISSASR